MRKLARIANVVVNVGKSCEKYNLNERDLPDGLRTILGSLQRSVHYTAMLSHSLTDEQRAGWSRTCTEEVRKGERRQRIPSA
jgi:hypothetical protein